MDNELSPEEREYLSSRGKGAPSELSDEELREAHGAGFFTIAGTVLGSAGGPGGAIAGAAIGAELDNPDSAY